MTSAFEICGFLPSRKSISSMAKFSIEAAEESRANEYTVFFIVSVARILLLSPSSKQLAKSPWSSTSTCHSLKSCRSAWRFTRTSRTCDLPYRLSASLTISSASPVRRVAVRAQQQRNMEVRLAAPNSKRDLHHRIQSFLLRRREVTCRIKRQPVKTFAQYPALRQQLVTPSVLIGLRGANRHPFAGRILTFQTHRHP